MACCWVAGRLVIKIKEDYWSAYLTFVFNLIQKSCVKHLFSSAFTEGKKAKVEDEL